MPVCSRMLFGHNLEMTRNTAFGGIYSEKINNRKFAAQKDGFPLGFYRIESNGICGIGQAQDQLYFESGVKYTLRIWAKCDSNTEITYEIKSRYFVSHYKNTAKICASNDYHLIEDQFTLYVTESRCAFEVTYPDNVSVDFMAFSIKETNHFHGMRKDVIEVLKQLKPGNLRYPGGCYAEFYHWKDGLLPVDFRPCTHDGGLGFLLPDTYGVDTHEIGIDEFIHLCRYLDAEPEITVRLSDNTPQDAADWVEYCNGSPDTKWGKLRAERGHVDPYSVKIWFIGNELAFFGRGGLSHYENAAAAHDLFVKAMKEADSSITVSASTGNIDEWDAGFLSKDPALDWTSYHIYFKDRYADLKSLSDIAKVVKAPTDYLLPVLKSRHKALNGLPISLDEWNYAWGKNGSAFTGVYAAGVLHMLIRNADSLNIRQACYFTPFNEGAIRIYPHGAYMNSDGLVFELLSKHAGNEIIDMENSNEALDIVCTRTINGSKTFVSIINRDILHTQPVEPDISGKDVHSTVLSPHNGDVTCDRLDKAEYPYLPDEIPPMSILLIEMLEGI